jgi:hypothetical protein
MNNILNAVNSHNLNQCVHNQDLQLIVDKSLKINHQQINIILVAHYLILNHYKNVKKHPHVQK